MEELGRESSKCPCTWCRRDHDLLVALDSKFEEYRKGLEKRLIVVETDRGQFLRQDVFTEQHKQIQGSVSKLEERTGALEKSDSRKAGSAAATIIIVGMVAGLLGTFTGAIINHLLRP